MNLFVSNISRTVNENALRALFSEFGEVASVKIIGDKYTGESRGFGFVNMLSDTQALIAIKRLENAEFFGRRLLVSKARPNVRNK
ncbi:RNA recognition motif domain-containing protein [Pseudochryseolinea flava]|uniref:RNA-binding protein n=1 Tax=Pseudochryseolinea flava TaxID=2059302 RepID=A0A364Y722_9BACT|nr:RNA-binding protein [Pseudochryseolinea flava]RAW02197.1 RNA-binding protein [Pseudochryseolinea flava]